MKPKSLQWALFLVGDVTDEIIASFPPSIMNRPTEGMIIVAQGLLGENEEFLVYRWTLPADTKPGASSSETPLQSFFKPSATPSTTTTPPTTTTPSPASSVTPTVTAVTPTVTSAVTTPLMCDQCSEGPFATQLALTGHKTSAHSKKPVKRLKKPGVSAYTPVAKQPTVSQMTPQATQTTPPTTPSVTPTTAITTDSTGMTAESPLTATEQPSQPSSGPVIELDSGPLKLVSGADQAVLPEQKVVPGEQTVVSPEQTVVQAVVQPSDSVISASRIQSPVASVVQPPVTTVPGTLKEELKAVDGASLASVKYTKLSGLIAKSLQDFKLQFEASFPKDDMAQA